MQDLIELRKDSNEFLQEAPSDTGIYQFLDIKKDILYVGKAKNLSNRVKSYFSKSAKKNQKISNLISQARYLSLTITLNELEALLLEQHLIKKFKPKFNVQFKDDKGYPWIRVGISKEYPFAKSFLGKKEPKDLYLGPFPTSYSVRETIKSVQKIFKIRDCSETVFKNRSRPCLQFEIGRCSAPCVGAIKKNDYLKEVRLAEKLLIGQGNHLDPVYSMRLADVLPHVSRRYQKKNTGKMSTPQ